VTIKAADKLIVITGIEILPPVIVIEEDYHLMTIEQMEEYLLEQNDIDILAELQHEGGPLTVEITGWTCESYDPAELDAQTFIATLDLAGYSGYDFSHLDLNSVTVKVKLLVEQTPQSL